MSFRHFAADDKPFRPFGAVESPAKTLPEIVAEMLIARTSERSGRLIDHDEAASMEKKKREGYF